MKYTDKELLDRVVALPSFKGWPDAMLDIWVRSKNDLYDQFDDKVYTFDCSGDAPKFVMACTGTTNAGAVGLKHFAKYNANGCAVLIANHIQYDSHVLGYHKGKYQAFIENPDSPFPYFRDSDKDDYAEEIGKEYYDCIGANCHHAGIYSTRIGGWSVACLVRNKLAEFERWLNYCKGRTHKITVAILSEF